MDHTAGQVVGPDILLGFTHEGVDSIKIGHFTVMTATRPVNVAQQPSGEKNG